ncbi:hypothetical protein LCGC14_2028050 [marine sediment metagenome]|uniref:YopX protein domain-containing protein n=1 Tax=marine sediment metagenome TaxID=412755 RepID=A0A0F9FI16_9ZZZZ
MDNIIYRSWDKETEEFIFSDQDSDEAWFEFNGGTLKAYAIHSMDAGSLDEPPQPNVVELERPELFTTIKDIKNMMIFQGDEVEASIYGDEKPQILTVEYRDTCFIIDDEDSESDCVPIGLFVGTLKIIGHIHKGGEMKEGG